MPGGSGTTSVFRVEYFNDTAQGVQKGNLVPSTFLINATATGNRDFGYWQGQSPGGVIPVCRLDYSSDTTQAVAKGAPTSVKYNVAATGNNDFGYFGGGYRTNVKNTRLHIQISSMDRLDYASDTVAMAPKGPLVTARTEHAATGDANFGYFGGGQNVNDPNGLATIDRVDYSNDTVSASPKGSLSVARAQLGATSSHHGALPTTAVPFPEIYNFATNVVQPPNFAVLSQPGNSGTNLYKYDFASNTASLLSGRNFMAIIIPEDINMLRVIIMHTLLDNTLKVVKFRE